MALPSHGYHVTYLDRLPSIMEQGLRPDMPAETRTGIGLTDAVYFITSPSQAHWAANDRSLDPSEDWVILRASKLNPDLIVADEDFGNTAEESLRYGGTFAYQGVIPPEHLEVIATAIGTEEYYHDEFRGLSRYGYFY